MATAGSDGRRVLSSRQDTDSRRECALMHGCSNSSQAVLTYLCQPTEPAVASGAGAGAGAGAGSGSGAGVGTVEYRVRVTYTLEGATPKVSKLLEVCELLTRRPSVQRACSGVKVSVLQQQLWEAIRPSCEGIACKTGNAGVAADGGGAAAAEDRPGNAWRASPN